MAIEWTEEQKKVIESRNRNLLVSAAAGSGKTAVLVERIIRMVTEGERPLDIDQLLVMTFTKAAAAEMKERVAAAVDRLLDERPGDSHLQVQSALVSRANIMTIDSFCLNLVREHFDQLDIDPSFRVMDEGEAVLLSSDVMQRMLEDYYETGDEAFIQFVETYAPGKTDGGIEDYIQQVYRFSQSHPWPKEWLRGCREELTQAGEAHVDQTAWMQYLTKDVRLQAEEFAAQTEEALTVCREEDGPGVYEPALLHDLQMMRELCQAQDYGELCGLLRSMAFDRLAAVRSKEVDPEKKAYVSSCRERVKKAVTKLKEGYCFETPEEMLRDIHGTRDVIGMLLDLTEEYADRYQTKKREKNVVDFNDMEHFALEILLTEEEGERKPSAVADELSRRFEEILVDEYQDSNDVQEELVRCVSRERFGSPNVFMVGDVKQSIYKFRLARPELFLKKYEAYGTEDGLYQKIELHQNFRSRDAVLAGVNQVFYRIMTKGLGNIAYTADTALHPGASFEDVSGRAGENTELLLVDTGTEAMKQLDEEAADYTSREMEAKLIAGKIREMTDPKTGLLIWDKEEGRYRTARYGDMVILLRSMAGYGETMVSVLMQEDIPAYAESRTGYFNTTEVETILSLLLSIDNPMQDIPLAAVLKSPIAGLSDEELAYLMAEYKRAARKGQDRGIYAAWHHYLEAHKPEEVYQYTLDFSEPEPGPEPEPEPGPERGPEPGSERGQESGSEQAQGPEQRAQQARNAKPGQTPNQNRGQNQGYADSLFEKLTRFEDLFESLRDHASYLPIHELLYEVYERTGYYDYVSAMPAGEVRRANLDMLVEKAETYEKTSYKGLFHFTRYIMKIQKYDTDFGEASVVGEHDDTVRIMSIHKSKGLEFPIVFLAGMGKKFNKRDAYGRILIDPDLGIGTDYLDLELRVKTTTLKKNVLKRRMELEALGEELRVLYVAMTRAKEKLIMTGTDRYLGKKKERFAHVPCAGGQVPFTILSTADSYLDWLLMSLSGMEAGGPIETQEIPASRLVGAEVRRQAVQKVSKEMLLKLDTSLTYDRDMREKLDEVFHYQYPYEEAVRLHTAMSVSELKKEGQMIDLEESDFLPTIPAFMRPEEKQRSGAYVGTAYHRVLELLDFARIHSLEETKAQIRSLCEASRLTAENYGLIRPQTVWNFLSSPLGRRMSRAQAEGRLHKERQFIITLPANEMEDFQSEEPVLVQGIIDAYIEEDEGLVLVDYKTDQIREGEERVLVERYGEQLRYYKKALEMMTGRAVTEEVIYSLRLQKEILVDL